jgi:3-oxoacyl-ACP reductase-like protein
MGILSTIFSKIFPSSHAAPAPAAPAAPAAGTAPAAGSTTAAAAPVQQVDVEAILNGMAQKNAQKLNWSTSIVDLMKLLDLDSSLTARKTLAQELKYSGDTNDSATMNIWLHKQVMIKLAENGGKVPDALKH